MIIAVKTSMGPFDNLLFRLQNKLRKEPAEFDYRTVPVIINNFNRLQPLLQQIAWLEKAGMNNIHIIDNNSSYAPLLAFYEKTPYTIYRLNKNIGFLALWKTVIYSRFRGQYYIYTDPDIVPVTECPLDAAHYFYNLLQRYPQAQKVGFGIKIDDIPAFYPLKEKVLQWEAGYWEESPETNVYQAPIDTTFALYRPGAKGGSELSAFRTGTPYIARHLSWYIDPAKLSEEDQYYLEHANNSASWTAELTGKERNIQY